MKNYWYGSLTHKYPQLNYSVDVVCVVMSVQVKKNATVVEMTREAPPKEIDHCKLVGGLDGNVDLKGITDNSYTKNNQSTTNTPAIDAGKEVENTPTSAVRVGDTVKVKFNVDAWSTSEAIPQWLKGNSYKVLLEGILSWISKGDIELLLDVATVTDNQSESTYVVQYGETLLGIAYQCGTDY